MEKKDRVQKWLSFESYSRSNPLSLLEVLKKRAKQLRKVIYSVIENWKGRKPKKDEDNVFRV